MHAETGNAITVRFALPSAALQPYVTTYYLIDVQTSPDEVEIEDYLHPEWANLRVLKEGWSQFAIGDQELRTTPAFSISGPSSYATRFRAGTGGNWGIGLMPLGWAKFIQAEASDYADDCADGHKDPAFAHLRPLAHALAPRFEGEHRDFSTEIALIEEHLSALLDRDVPHADIITAINAAMVDPDIGSASQLADQVGMNLRSLERFSRRVFGFPPKLLLRRQRFLRSLAQFMLDPSLKWMSTLDYQYHDQAHFVRDFKRFMGMTPGAYAKLQKPLLAAAAQARMAIAGEAVQGLHEPIAKG